VIELQYPPPSLGGASYSEAGGKNYPSLPDATSSIAGARQVQYGQHALSEGPENLK